MKKSVSLRNLLLGLVFIVFNSYLVVYFNFCISSSVSAPYLSMKSSLGRQTRNQIVLLGGGPSATPPLVYLLATQSTSVEFYGEVTDSLLFRGRDPQKTFRGLLDIAKKYKTFEKLREKTTLYYTFLNTVARKFDISLDTAINAVYKEKYSVFGNRIMLNKQGTTEFVEAKAVNQENQLGFTLNDKDLLLKSIEKGIYYLGDSVYENFAQIHKELHYLPIYFTNWKTPEKLTSHSESTIINRSGFRYPGYHTRQLLAALNRDLALLCFKLLSESQELSELEQTMKTHFSVYTERVNDNILTTFDKVAIVGGGRAAGEIARRLANDVDWKKTIEFFTTHFKGRVDEAKMNDIFKKYDESILKRKKEVIVVDHKFLEAEDIEYASEKFLTVVSSGSYSDFFLEICKHGVCPCLTTDQIEYYTSLLNKISSIEALKSFSIVERIQHLLDHQDDTEKRSHYGLSLTKTRDVMSCETDFPEHVVFSIGGAKQFVKHNENLYSESYELKRIKTSHYRYPNLKYIEAVGNQEPLDFATQKL